MTSLYALPVPPRAGLGNMLLPWARAELFAKRRNGKILAPFWPPFRIGPYLRDEPERRNYRGFFQAPAHIRGLKKQWILLSSQRVKEADVGTHQPVEEMTGNRLVILFEGLGEEGAYFRPLLQDRHYIRDLLWNMTAAPLRDLGWHHGEKYIAFHVRRGDITRQGLTTEQLNQLPVYTSIAWFRQIAEAMGRQLPTLPIVLFTDGSEHEVWPLLELNNVRIHPRRAAITDLWALSHARLLVATGYSTFSMWASYLGGMPTIYAPGKMQEPLHGRNGLEIELAADESIPPAMLETV